MKEPTVLINMRIPKSVLKEFNENVEKDPLVPSRTYKIIQMMDRDNKRKRKLYNKE